MRGREPALVVAAVLATVLIAGVLALLLSEDVRNWVADANWAAAAPFLIAAVPVLLGVALRDWTVRREHQRTAMEQAGEEFCTVVSRMNSALTDLRHHLDPRTGSSSERIEEAMSAVTRAANDVHAASARVRFVFGPGKSPPERTIKAWRENPFRFDHRSTPERGADAGGGESDTGHGVAAAERAHLIAVLTATATDALRDSVAQRQPALELLTEFCSKEARLGKYAGIDEPEERCLSLRRVIACHRDEFVKSALDGLGWMPSSRSQGLDGSGPRTGEEGIAR
jgi:hypothetical protein